MWKHRRWSRRGSAFTSRYESTTPPEIVRISPFLTARVGVEAVTVVESRDVAQRVRCHGCVPFLETTDPGRDGLGGAPAETRHREPVGDQVELRVSARVERRWLAARRLGPRAPDPPPPVEAPREHEHERHEQPHEVPADAVPA